MPIIVNLDVMMAKRKMSLNELSDKVGLTLSNLSILKLQSFHLKDREGKSYKIQYTGNYLRCAAMSAG